MLREEEPPNDASVQLHFELSNLKVNLGHTKVVRHVECIDILRQLGKVHGNIIEWL